jgi:hypothetical protein
LFTPIGVFNAVVYARAYNIETKFSSNLCCTLTRAISDIPSRFSRSNSAVGLCDGDPAASDTQKTVLDDTAELGVGTSHISEWFVGEGSMET